METEINPGSERVDLADDSEAMAPSSFHLSARPVISVEPGREDDAAEKPDLPRSYGTQTLCLMARDPHSIFAYWDIDWKAAFREQAPEDRKVHLRLLDSAGSEQCLVEVEPMAGNCYVSVPDADATYGGEIGFFGPATVWNRLAASELVTTPPDTVTSDEEVDFATVPFHLSFQHMIDTLRIAKQENESLVAMLANLRQRTAAPDGAARLSEEERELARVLESAEAKPTPTGRANAWSQQKLDRILGYGTSSPTGAFGGSSRAV